MTHRSRIMGIGMAVPSRVVTNHDLAKMFETTHEWIVERTGIEQRHWVEPGEGGAELAAKAKEIYDAINDILSEMRNNMVLVQGELPNITGDVETMQAVGDAVRVSTADHRKVRTRHPRIGRRRIDRGMIGRSRRKHLAVRQQHRRPDFEAGIGAA